MNISSEDDFLYHYLIKLLKEVRLVRGGTDLAYTLRNRKAIREYLRKKQVDRLDYIETTFFDDKGNLDPDIIQNFNVKRTLQNL